jgi:hypothetical protein
MILLLAIHFCLILFVNTIKTATMGKRYGMDRIGPKHKGISKNKRASTKNKLNPIKLRKSSKKKTKIEKAAAKNKIDIDSKVATATSVLEPAPDKSMDETV